LGAHETLIADHSAVRVSCPTSIDASIDNSAGLFAVQSPPESLTNLDLTPLPGFASNLSQFSDLNSSQVIEGRVDDFVPHG
jgi:hypothetical protein